MYCATSASKRRRILESDSEYDPDSQSLEEYDPDSQSLEEYEIDHEPEFLKHVEETISENSSEITEIDNESDKDLSKEKDDFKIILSDVIAKAINESYSHKDEENIFEDCKDKELLRAKLKEIRGKIKENTITLEDILREPTTEKDKIELVRHYDILKNMDPESMEFLELEKYIKNKILKIRSIPLDELTKINQEQSRLKTVQPPSDYEIKRKIYNLDANDKVKSKLYDMHNDLENITRENSEYNIIKAKLLWAISLPHRKIASPMHQITHNSDIKDINKYCSMIYKKLDENLYGMTSVKERLMQTVVNRVFNPHTKSMLGLSSPPGRGKTAVASALAKAMDLPFERISLGGMEDPSIFKGTDNSWVGASPGIILHILRRMKVSNGIVLFDEIDKLGSSVRGREIQYALLHITDYVQNKEYHDLFLSEFTHDLSNIWFMFAMNNHEWLDPALKDRLDIVKIEKYSRKDINNIITRHFLPAAVANAGLKPEDITITTDACRTIQSKVSYGIDTESEGLRSIEKEVTTIISKINLLRVINVEGENCIKLSYNLKDFKGLPYQITSETVENLVERRHVDPSYIKMYM